MSSLDVLRGLLLIASVGVNSLPFTPASIDHHPWAGVHAIDLIFPFFVTMTGCGIAFAYRNGITSWPRLVRRVVVLFALGLLYNAVTTNQWDLATWRITGVLQLYALVICVVSIGHIWLRTWQKWLAVTLALVLVYTVIVIVVAHGCPGGALTPECNPSLWETRLFGGAHSYRLGVSGHDPEGLFATFGALVSVAAGATVGHAIIGGMRTPARPPAGTARVVAGIVVVFLVVAALAVFTPYLTGVEPMPIMKRLWTPPFALLIASGVAACLFLLHLLLDVSRDPAKARRLRVTYPLQAMGKNSLLVYFGSHALNAILGMFPSPGNSIMGRFIGLFGGGWSAEIGVTVFMIAAWMGLAVLLHRHRIYLRA